MEVIVSPAFHQWRLDLFLSKVEPERSRTRWQDIIAQGYVSLEGSGAVMDPNWRVQQGQIYHVAPLPEAILSGIAPFPMTLHLYYEDEDLLVLEKPAGVVVHPGAGTYEPTLIQGVLFHCKELPGISGVQQPGIVHRLDKDTSGLMVVAKTEAAHHALSHQFMERTVGKVYLAFVWGIPKPSFGVIETFLDRDSRHRHKRCVSLRGKIARTRYRLVAQSDSKKSKIRFPMSLLECRPETGRTHQIRVHCTYLGHPIVGDCLYGHGRGHSRQALHAHGLRFTHPRTQEILSFTSALPFDLQHLWEEHFVESSAATIVRTGALDASIPT